MAALPLLSRRASAEAWPEGVRYRVLAPDPGRAIHPALGRNRCVEDVYEPFLIMQGMLARTPRGRIALMRAIADDDGVGGADVDDIHRLSRKRIRRKGIGVHEASVLGTQDGDRRARCARGGRRRGGREQTRA